VRHRLAKRVRTRKAVNPAAEPDSSSVGYSLSYRWPAESGCRQLRRAGRPAVPLEEVNDVHPLTLPLGKGCGESPLTLCGQRPAGSSQRGCVTIEDPTRPNSREFQASPSRNQL
jgi:hypothetical protein